MKRIASFLILLPLIQACAIHAPVSEMVMFNPKQDIVTENEIDSLDSKYSNFGISFSGQGQWLNQQLVHDLGREQQGDYNDFEDSNNDYALSINTTFFLKNSDRIAANLSVLPTSGVDVTVKTIENFYLTYGYTAYGGQQVLMQRRLRNSATRGVAVGVFYEQIEQFLFDKNCFFCFGPDERLLLNAAGARMLFVGHNGFSNRTYFLFNAKLGYTFDIESPYVSLGFNYGIY